MSSPHPDVTRLLAESEPCLRPLGQATTLPPEVFANPAWFEAERGRVFHSGWVAVARSSEVTEPNQFVTASIAGEPCIVVRTREGRLNALSNVCRHRGTTVIDERAGTAPSLQCNHHQWTYSHEGELRAAPAMDAAEDFDMAAVCLPRFAVDEWQGWVLVNVDANAAPLSDAAPALDALMSEYRATELHSIGTLEYPSPWNWKISVENFLESYHHRGIHPETLEPTFPGLQSFVPPTGTEPWTGVDHVSVVDGEEPFLALVAYPSLLLGVTRG
ncbi:MAG: aromatic ring-hydroxylating oxygenase subunit alpha, partial [Acidimicrobiales bacterium]